MTPGECKDMPWLITALVLVIVFVIGASFCDGSRAADLERSRVYRYVDKVTGAQ
jgi:hypothetical protein